MGRAPAGTWALGAAAVDPAVLKAEITRLERVASRLGHCLVADGQQTMRLLLGQAIREAGFSSVHLAGDGKSAWQSLQEHDCDLAVVDLNLAELDGLGLLDRVRSHPDLAGMVFIMVSGDNLDRQVLRVAEEPWDVYLAKPVSPRRLTRRLDMVVQRRLATARALLLESGGQVDRAVEMLLGAVHDHPGFTWPLFVLARLLERAGRDGEAGECYQRALDMDPAAASALVGMGRILQKSGDGPGARALYRRALEANPSYYRAYDVLADSLALDGRGDQALAVLEAAVRRRGGQNAGRLERLGGFRMQAGRYAEAEESFIKALDLRPHRHVGSNRFNLGKARLAQGRWAEAVVDLRAAARAAAAEGDTPTATAAVFSMVEAHLERGYLDLAEEVLAEAVDPAAWPGETPPLAPAEIMARAGRLFLDRGHLGSARRSFIHSLNLAGADADALQAVQRWCEAAGHPEVGQAVAAAVTARRPSALEEIVSRAIALVRQQSYPEAETLYRQALDLAPDSGRVHFNLSKLYLRLNQSQAAGRHLGLATRWGLADADWDLVLETAKVFEGLGQAARARRVLQQVLERQPENREASRRLAQLNRRQAARL